MLMFQTLPNCPGGGGGDLSRSPHEFRWCWSRRPWLGALHVWGVHVMTRGNDSRLEGLLATTVLDGRGMLSHLVLMLQMHQRCPVGALSRFPHGFRWCSKRPMLGALHDGSVHVMIRIYGRWLAWRSRLV